MKKLAVLAAVLLLLAGAGAGGWWLSDRRSAAGETPPPAFVTLPLMSIPVIRDDDRISRTVALQITLELGRPEDKVSVERAVPHLANAFLIELHALLPRRFMQERGSDLDLMKYRLVDVANRVLGSSQVTDVLIKALGERQAR